MRTYHPWLRKILTATVTVQATYPRLSQLLLLLLL
jgi:hypothetical protein